jgi:hypothetical protein
MTWTAFAFLFGALIGSVFPAFRLRPAASFTVKKEEDGNPWDARFW